MIVRYGVIVYPGTNCEPETMFALNKLKNSCVEIVWHESETNLSQYDCVVIPGGYAYWDYLRPGCISAKLSPIRGVIVEFVRGGGVILGICNGFQVLLEMGLLPGCLLPNASGHFECKFSYLKTANSQSRFSSLIKKREPIRVPIAHGIGNYYCPEETLEELKKNNQIIFQYCDKDGDCNPESNPNGSVNYIAGICNKEGNILGMMPHPERANDKQLGSDDGILILESIHQSIIETLNSKED